MLKRYVDVVCFLGMQELPFRGHNEGIASSNRGNYYECLQFLSEYDSEIKDCHFIAILLDETTDVSHLSQLSTIVRFCSKSGEIKERFLGFSDVSNDRTAAALCSHVLTTMERYSCGNKLVAQTYDGAAVMASHLNGTQAKVKEMYPRAIFIHCFAHILNLVLSQSVSYVDE